MRPAMFRRPCPSSCQNRCGRSLVPEPPRHHHVVGPRLRRERLWRERVGLTRFAAHGALRAHVDFHEPPGGCVGERSFPDRTIAPRKAGSRSLGELLKRLLYVRARPARGDEENLLNTLVLIQAVPGGALRHDVLLIRAQRLARFFGKHPCDVARRIDADDVDIAIAVRAEGELHDVAVARIAAAVAQYFAILDWLRLGAPRGAVARALGE